MMKPLGLISSLRYLMKGEQVSSSYTKLQPELCTELKNIIDIMSTPGKGLIATDESPNSLDERFKAMNVENTETTRRDYREMLFCSNKISEYISGAILHHETVYQKTSSGETFIDLLKHQQLIPGIKVDKGLIPLFGSENENTTQGLDDLKDRCIQYKKDGCQFAKWRCTFHISSKTPSTLAYDENANVLARYATICQSTRIVPIVEPEILLDGDFGIERASEVLEELLSVLFRKMNEHHVYLEGCILKPAMVLPGIQSGKSHKPEIVAEYTLQALQRTVPCAVPAIMFLSGGQSDENAIGNLDAINKDCGKKPWILSFCYGRTLQNAAMKVWKGNGKNTAEAQKTLLKRAMLCSQASLGNLDTQKLKKL